jgi:hypothetical protein
MSNTRKTFTITKKVAKHGPQSVIVIPKFLNEEIKPKTVVEAKITILKEDEENDQK